MDCGAWDLTHADSSVMEYACELDVFEDQPMSNGFVLHMILKYTSSICFPESRALRSLETVDQGFQLIG